MPAGRMLFLRDRFTEEVLGCDPSLTAIRSLKGIFGNTLSTTLYRFVEIAGEETPIVGLMSCHPHAERRPQNITAEEAIRHLIRSTAFEDRFSNIDEATLFNAIRSYSGSQRGGPLGESEISLADVNGEMHRFYFETFFNHYDALTLGVYIAPTTKIYGVSAP